MASRPASGLMMVIMITWIGRADGYRPVVIVHGIFDGPKQFETLSHFITKAHPGTEVTVVDLYDNLASLKPMWLQVCSYRKAIKPIATKATGGIHLLCFSQGGLICRALLQTMPEHNVHSFISLSSPQGGQYGDTSYLRWLFPEYLKKSIFHLCYNRFGQRLSICGYWNDPHHRQRYLEHSSFLAFINAERQHSLMQDWKENFLRIRKLVLIGGPDDDVITPWQSSHFGFYDSHENIIEMKKQNYYLKDGFGLRTLEARGDVSVCELSGVKHTSWHSNVSVFSSCIEQWLT